MKELQTFDYGFDWDKVERSSETRPARDRLL